MVIIMNNLDIIEHIQTKYNDIEKNTLIRYIYSLIKTEFLRYNNDVVYFDNNFQDILFGKKDCKNELDYAIDQAIFIVLQPLRNDLNPKNIEQTLLSWSGYILNRNTDSGCYPKDIIHYFENDDFDIERLMSMDKNDIQEIMEYDRMVDFEKKEYCAKLLCKKINDLLIKKDNITDDEFNSFLAIINYRFIRIHPFEDGNGRVSRMLLNYVLNQKNGYVPIGLSNSEINEMIEIYKKTSKIIYTAFMGTYLSNLEYDDSDDYMETETLLTSNIASFLTQKQQEVKEKLGLDSNKKLK